MNSDVNLNLKADKRLFYLIIRIFNPNQLELDLY